MAFAPLIFPSAAVALSWAMLRAHPNSTRSPSIRARGPTDFPSILEVLLKLLDDSSVLEGFPGHGGDSLTHLLVLIWSSWTLPRALTTLPSTRVISRRPPASGTSAAGRAFSSPPFR